MIDATWRISRRAHRLCMSTKKYVAWTNESCTQLQTKMDTRNECGKLVEWRQWLQRNGRVMNRNGEV